mmetsp:Transcript_53005/g.139767  ORF Transcript_53005/g.139767 Transcript_53005/m.139767 type:complete len:118 (+) Transcript_53005:583-936(+)
MFLSALCTNINFLTCSSNRPLFHFRVPAGAWEWTPTILFNFVLLFFRPLKDDTPFFLRELGGDCQVKGNQISGLDFGKVKSFGVRKKREQRRKKDFVHFLWEVTVPKSRRPIDLPSP